MHIQPFYVVAAAVLAFSTSVQAGVRSDTELNKHIAHLQSVPPQRCRQEIQKDLLTHLEGHRAYMHAATRASRPADHDKGAGDLHGLTTRENEQLALAQDLVCGPKTNDAVADSSSSQEGPPRLRKRMDINYKPPFPNWPPKPQPRPRPRPGPRPRLPRLNLVPWNGPDDTPPTPMNDDPNFIARLFRAATGQDQIEPAQEAVANTECWQFLSTLVSSDPYCFERSPASSSDPHQVV